MPTSEFSYSQSVVVGLLLCVAAGWGFYVVGLDAFLEAAYSGEAWPYFNEMAERWRGRQEAPSLQQFLREARTLLFRFGFLGTVVTVLFAGMQWVRPRLFASFFSETTSPFNLALFRIVIFGLLLAFDLGASQWYAQLPATLQFPPPGLSGMLSILSTDPTLVSVMTVIFRGACVFGLLGLFTRGAATVALLSGLYVLGIPQFYGKVNHYHHVLWFTALLIPSRCADVLSLDAVRTSGQSSTVSSPEADQVYALPLRFAWVLLGILYFFPGAWKFAGEGMEWALSDNLKYRMHLLWFVQSFTPVFRIDKYPVLYQSAGVCTMLFEVGFFFAILIRRLRSWAAGAALLFHESTRLFLSINFWTMYPILPFLLDIRAGLVQIGRGLYPQPLMLTYNSSIDWERQVVDSLLRMDVLDRLREQERGPGTVDEKEGLAVAATASQAEALWLDNRLQWKALFRVLQAVPTALLLLPLIPMVGRRAGAPLPKRQRGYWAVGIIGSILIAGNVFCGIAKINSYPFSVYPTFAMKADSTVTSLRVEGIDAEGETTELLSGGWNHSTTGFSSARFRGLMRSILRLEKGPERQEKFHALWSVLLGRLPKLRKIREVRFYETTYVTNPDRRADRLQATSLLTTITVSTQCH